MIIDCLSDTHGQYPTTQGGDLLIVAGDCTAADKVAQWMEFFDWLKAQNYRQKVLVGGNHDGFLERCISSQEAREMLIDAQEGFEYLCDNGIVFEGLKIWGSPWTPRFCDWHFMLSRREQMKEKWDKIPDDTDILVTHGPPFGILDKARRWEGPGEHVGCQQLMNAIFRVKPKVHVFGHIHEWGGRFIDTTITKFVNCSIMDEDYKVAHKPMRIEL